MLLYRHRWLILIFLIYYHFLKKKNVHLYDVDAHGCERQAEHQVYYRTHHVYGMLNQSINESVKFCESQISHSYL